MNSEFFEVKERQPERAFVKIYKDFLQTDLLTAEEKLLYICLKSYAKYGKDEDNVYPSIESLCQMSRLGRTTVKKYLSGLAKKGVIQREQRGLTKTNLYTLSDSAFIWAAKTTEELQERVQEESERSREELIEENKRLREEIRRLKEKGLSSTSADQSNVDESPKSIYKYTATRQNTNKSGERQAQDVESKKRNRNKFCDFQQRDTDIDELEKLLLRQQLGEQ